MHMPTFGKGIFGREKASTHSAREGRWEFKFLDRHPVTQYTPYKEFYSQECPAMCSQLLPLKSRDETGLNTRLRWEMAKWEPILYTSSLDSRPVSTWQTPESSSRARRCLHDASRSRKSATQWTGNREKGQQQVNTSAWQRGGLEFWTNRKGTNGGSRSTYGLMRIMGRQKPARIDVEFILIYAWPKPLVNPNMTRTLMGRFPGFPPVNDEPIPSPGFFDHSPKPKADAAWPFPATSHTVDRFSNSSNRHKNANVSHADGACSLQSSPALNRHELNTSVVRTPFPSFSRWRMSNNFGLDALVSFGSGHDQAQFQVGCLVNTANKPAICFQESKLVN
ncbi:hypothetical protein SODALDRAFT_354803 [Sodiomyces alkalinus F11]|uniref:Uncharacterized protein n=1 Tax=Sodiomyces alkalinus (strain CBS 110278 / VKM F-3762 / F11) TaxID=1314773 RepID=A0A3N2Q778_SODAK|nr:hypothetical protein SODALDRAFT_354803 [Sodiomyces alkalinus F11]ROT42641.1 hypothetical protein SODALDRAFT_354803 [Sodiomyces alkalinus F11]